jgi:hypothetical protein
MRTYTQGDLERALILLPSPLFRHDNIYGIAVELGFRKAEGESLWYRLVRDGLIVRTNVPIGLGNRWMYWERTQGTPHAALNTRGDRWGYSN